VSENQQNNNIVKVDKNTKISIDSWFNTQKLENNSDHLPTKALHPLKEVLVNELDFITNMQQLRNGLEVMRGKVDKGEIIDAYVIDSYLKNLGETLSLYKNLNFFSSIDDPKKTGNEVIKELVEKYKHLDFKKLVESLVELEFKREKINELSTKEKYKFTENTALVNSKGRALQFDSFTIMPSQRTMRFSMPLAEIVTVIKNNSKKTNDATTTEGINESIKLIQGLTADFNRRKPELEEFNLQLGVLEYFTRKQGNTQEKQVLMLRELLDMNLNNPLENGDDHEVKKIDFYTICHYIV
jgi:hypothetical protein